MNSVSLRPDTTQAVQLRKERVFSIDVSTGRYTDFIKAIIGKAQSGKSDYACVANVHMLIEAHNNPAFADTVNGASIITPDGKPITWAVKMLYGHRQDRVAGMDLLPDLLREAAAKKLPVYFYGGSPAMLSKAELYLQEKFPNLTVAGMYSPPFRKLSATEEERVVEKINNSGARLVLVILGCPKQERWMQAMKGRVAAYMVGVGGALPVLIGMQKRAPRWMQARGLEWLYRLYQEPKRLFRRYAVTNVLFVNLFLKSYLRKKLAGSRA